MYYRFIGVTNGLYEYDVTLRLLQRCGSGRQFPNPTIISIFDKTTNLRVTDMAVTISYTENIGITDPDPCITNPPYVCYDVAYYNFRVRLPATAAGYVMASQVNYRINGINNLSGGYNNIGATYSCDIPGTSGASDGPENNSAAFTSNDLVVVCANNDFTYSFAAEDEDGDILRYSFCHAYASQAAGGGGATSTDPPPFPLVPYGSPFEGSMPLGPGVTVNPNTGLVSGVAPAVGIYVITVCVEEIRDGVVIARQRKDVQINIADCDIASASLLPEYQLCKNTQTISLANQSSSPLIVTTDWEFYDSGSNMIYSSTGLTTTYTFPAIGLYTVKLVINRGQGCTDSTTSLIRVFPGFNPDFGFNGICVNRPTLFTDNTSSVYGTPNSWNWDFGELSVSNDVSTAQHPTYTYPTMSVKSVRLIASDTRGCRDTVTKEITIIDKPPLSVAFKDTLICINDQLPLQAIGTGNFSWTPLTTISNPNTANPTVSPPVTTTYYVELENSGCRNLDSVRVRVVNFVTIQPMPDTIICRGDTIQLRVVSDGLHYSWSPASQIIDPAVQNPYVFTNNALTNYQVTAVIGGCSATSTIRVNTVPYPAVNAGPDFTICYNAKAQLNGSTDGSSWQWSPAHLVSNPTILNPTSYPPRTTDYVLSAYDTRGCPKPGRDTVKVTVLPKMHVSAGNDTAVIAGQPLQFHGTGALNYQWVPALHLSAFDIANPIGIYPQPTEGMRYKLIGYSPQGCKDSAFVTVKVFKTNPIVFVPTAFTPNNDGRNDQLRPIAVGIKFIEYFSIYNRWGQLVFTTQRNGHGWDGKINGVEQSTGTFVWTVKAVDYLGKAYFQKGTVTLIR